MASKEATTDITGELPFRFGRVIGVTQAAAELARILPCTQIYLTQNEVRIRWLSHAARTVGPSKERRTTKRLAISVGKHSTHGTPHTGCRDTKTK